MRNSLCLLACVVLTGCSGCAGYVGTRTPLQPGDKIVFAAAPRANAFRQASGNDLNHTNRVVAITRPTTLVTE